MDALDKLIAQLHEQVDATVKRWHNEHSMGLARLHSVGPLSVDVFFGATKYIKEALKFERMQYKVTAGPVKKGGKKLFRLEIPNLEESAIGIDIDGITKKLRTSIADALPDNLGCYDVRKSPLRNFWLIELYSK